MFVAEYLEKIGLLEQVEKGVLKHYKPELASMIFVKLHECKFEFMNSVRNAGDCFGMKKVRLNSKVAEHPKDRDDTVLHEVGHLIHNCKVAFYGESQGNITYKYVKDSIGFKMVRVRERRSSHGKEWKSIMIAIGGKPERCHDFKYLRSNNPKKKFKHKYVCKDCGYEYKTMRKLKNIHNRYHTGCKRKPNKGKLTHIVLR